MLKKGTMLNVKKVIGIGVGLIGVGMAFGIEQINTIVQSNQLIAGILLISASYFLVISGRQL